MEYSQKSIRIAYLRYLADRGNDDFGRFLIQQNFIQFMLAKLIQLRSKYLNKKLIEKIDEQTLGSLINFYKICWNKNGTEDKLLCVLEQYNNESRNPLVHKMIDTILKGEKIDIVYVNKQGLNIIRLLDGLLEAELSQK